MNQNTKKLESKKTTRVFLINKRDKIDDYIRNCITKYNEFLTQTNEEKELRNLNNLFKNKEVFLKKSNDVIDQVKQMKSEIFNKRDKFVASIKEYVNSFIIDQKTQAKEKTIQIEKEYESAVAKIQNEIITIKKEKVNLQKLKLDASKNVKFKIDVIRKELLNEEKFDFSFETENIKKLYDNHKKFVKEKIEGKVIILNTQLIKLYNELKKLTMTKMSTISHIIKNAKEKIKDEFLFLSGIEKTVIKKIIHFKDFLEDVEYFANDKARKYEIIIAKAKIIKADSSQKIMQDVNQLLSFVSNSEGMFDNVDSLLLGINQRANNKVLNQKLTHFEENVLNTISSKLLVNKIDEEF